MGRALVDDAVAAHEEDPRMAVARASNEAVAVTLPKPPQAKAPFLYRASGIWGVRIVTAATILGSWQLYARNLPRALGAPPSEIASAAWHQISSGSIVQPLESSMIALSLGFVLALAVGIPIGIAMGRSGTEAAREAASIVLTDDDFATIVIAVAEGRRIGDNIRKFVAFLLSANLGEVLVFAVAIGAGLGMPLSVVQVLVVNLVTDGLPAVALAQDPTDPSTMRSPPRRSAHLFGRRLWSALALIGLAVGGVTLGSFEIGRSLGGEAAQTMAFTTLALSELALVFAIRSTTTPAWRLAVNHWLIWSVVISVAVVAAAVYVPATNEALSTVSLSLSAALVAVGLALFPFALVESAKGARRRSRPALDRLSRRGDLRRRERSSILARGPQG